MLESITYHTFLEAIGVAAVACLFIYPVLGTIWDISRLRYLKEQEAKRAAKEATR